MTVTTTDTAARPLLPPQIGELLFFLSLALDLPEAVGYHYDRERAALLEARAKAANEIIQRALAPGADLDAIVRDAHDIADTHPITYPARCGDCGRIPCRCPDDTIADIQREQAIVDAARAAAEARGQHPPLSGTPGYEAWRRRVLLDAGETHQVIRGQRVPL